MDISLYGMTVWVVVLAIYLKSHISYRIVSMSSQPSEPDAGEHLLIEVQLYLSYFP